jgi:aminoglycoside phosphotransferase (APT) family kinase protein
MATLLPPEVPHPKIVSCGDDGRLEWLVIKRVPGVVLSRAWPYLRERERRDAVHQLGVALSAFHSARVPEDFVVDPALEFLHQLPAPRLLEQIESVRSLPHVDRGLLDELAALVLANASALDDAPYRTVVHGDLHFENILWANGQLAAILDLEWSRPAPRDLDLDVFLNFCADPSLHVAEDYGHLMRPRDYWDAKTWLEEAYPELFSHPRLADRLALYRIAYDVRELLLDPPAAPAASLHPQHPYRRLQKLVRTAGRRISYPASERHDDGRLG